MFDRALSRPPTEDEQRRFVMLLLQLAEETPASAADILGDGNVWQDAAHAVFNMKELVFVR